VRGEHPAKTFPAFINLARANPGKISYGSAGVGSAGFLTGELLKQLAKIDMVHIPYKGTGPALTDMLGGQIDAMFNALIAAAPHIRGGKVRALAITAEHRDPDFPEVPTMAESVPGAVGDAWFGIAVPAKTPPAVAEQLRIALARSMEAPEFRQKLNALGLAPMPLGPKELLAFIDAENRKWAPVIRAANIKPE
jgi:tripartite-type tricarboxylate transporter receptor subunit TctC